jgi:hypothetical protein
MRRLDGEWMGSMSSMKYLLSAIMGVALVATAGAAGATVYTSDSNLADFASTSTQFATFSNFGAGDVGSPYTPTFATLSAGLRAYGGGAITGLPVGNNWIMATFKNPVSAIRIFPNIDHFGAQYDGYQYTIEGSNNGLTWTPLFDATGVAGASEPFTLASFTGTAPSRVNNVLSPGAGPGGTVGYIADFGFGGAYKYYAFGASSVAFAQGNTDQELSAVSAGVPEPATWAMMLLGFVGVGLATRRGFGKTTAAV